MTTTPISSSAAPNQASPARETSHFGWVDSRASRTPFGQALRKALTRAVRTLADACREAQINDKTVYGWASGDHVPWREDLLRLVAVLDAPELLVFFRPRWRRISVSCLECGGIENYTPSYLRICMKKGLHPGLIIDWEHGKGTYPQCAKCTWQLLGKDSWVARKMRRLRRKKGPKAVREIGRRLGSNIPSEDRKDYEERRIAAVRAKVWSEGERWHLSVSRIKSTQAGRFGICRICPYITYSVGPNSVRRPGETNRECLLQYRRKHQDRFGPIYPPRPRGRRPSTTELADTFEMAVRHLLRGEDVGRWEGGKGLAADFGLPHRTINERINTFLARLPPNGRGGKKLTLWAKALKEAKARRPEGPKR